MEFRQLARTVGHSVGKKIHPVPISHNVDELPTLRRTVRVPAGQLAGDLAVPALLHSLCFAPSVELLADPRLPLQPLGTVVTSQAWELVESVGSGDVTAFQLDARIVFLKRDGAGLHATVECTLVVDGAGVADGGDAGATPCYRECTSYLDKSGRGAAESVGEVPDLMSLVPNLRTRFGTNGAGRLDVGQARAEVTERFDASAAKQWAHLTGDINPIHVSQAAARMLGYKSTILHGAAIDAWATGRLGGSANAPCRGAAAFRAPVMLPARLELVPLDGHNYAVMEERTGRDLVHLFYEGLAPTAPADGAIVLPREDGRASSTLVAQGMCSGAAAGLPRLRNSIEEAVPWRRQYRGAMEELSWFDAPERGASCAQAGLDALAEILHFADGRPLSEAAIVRPASGGGVIRGSGGAGDARPELRVELDGKSYSGQALADLLGQWDGASRLQPDAYATLAHLAEDPGELTFDGLTFVCLGAGAELSPSRQLLQWGADVAAVIRPGSERRAELLELAQAGTGTLYLPPDDAADISVEPERVAGWIADLPGKLVIVDSLYAPGAAFLIAAAGADVVERLVCRARPDTVLAWIGTPTDSYRLETTGIKRQLGEGPAAKAVAGYAALRRVRPGRIGGVYPGFVDVQGPNYAAAKRIARWRATVERAAGRTVSFNVGPMSLTSSVTNNAILRTAYAGLDRLGMPPLPPEVSATLMAALLLWDLHYPEAVQESDTFLTDKAIDCGFFSSPYEPNGLMKAAVALGAGDTVASGVRKLLRR